MYEYYLIVSYFIYLFLCWGVYGYHSYKHYSNEGVHGKCEIAWMESVLDVYIFQPIYLSHLLDHSFRYFVISTSCSLLSVPLSPLFADLVKFISLDVWQWGWRWCWWAQVKYSSLCKYDLKLFFITCAVVSWSGASLSLFSIPWCPRIKGVELVKCGRLSP